MTLDMDNVEELLEDVFVNSSVSPTRANFKGEFNVGSKLHNTRVLLKRGKCVPQSNNVADIKNKLLWITPNGEDPILMWCDHEGKLYKLKFYPLIKP
jgi:hypothetical protein